VEHLISTDLISTVPEAALVELREIYARLATALEPYRRHCDMRGVCCDFAKCGHMLYVTGLEAAEMIKSGVAPDPALAEDGKCPFLRGNQCGIRDHRAIGCRIYYCDKTYNDERNALCEKYLREAREIEARYGIEHSYMAITNIVFAEAKHGEG
jgi:hypothetical protein